MWERSVREESWCIEHMYLVNTERNNLLLHSFESSTHAYSLKLHTEGIGQLAGPRRSCIIRVFQNKRKDTR